MKNFMQNKNPIISILPVILMLLFISACSASHITEKPTIPITVTSSPTTTPSSIITSKEALEQMYGKDIDVQSNYDNYEPHDAILTTATGGKYYIRVNMLSCYRDYLEREKCLIITDKSKRYTCQICGTQIDGAVFDRTTSGWKMHALNLNMKELTPNGLIPKGELIQIGRGRYAALVRGGYSIHGVKRESLVIIAETEQTFGVVFYLFNSIYKYDSFDGKWGFATKLEFTPDETNAEYDHIVVNYYGTSQDGTTPPLQVYKFIDTQYVLYYEQK
jgi:hypothetical protein